MFQSTGVKEHAFYAMKTFSWGCWPKFQTSFLLYIFSLLTIYIAVTLL